MPEQLLLDFFPIHLIFSQFNIQGSHGLVFNTTGDHMIKITQIGIHVKGKSVHGNPTAGTLTFFLLHRTKFRTSISCKIVCITYSIIPDPIEEFFTKLLLLISFSEGCNAMLHTFHRIVTIEIVLKNQWGYYCIAIK